MKRKALLALILVSAILMFSCGDDDDPPPNNGGNNSDGGTPGLAFELITVGGNANMYRVREGTVTGGEVVIPSTYNGLPVTEIGSVHDEEFEGAFRETHITSITIPSSVTIIGGDAFSDCTGLTGITIPASVTRIGKGAFVGCTSLTGITIPAGVTIIDDYAFHGSTKLFINVDTNNPNYTSESGALYNKAKTTLFVYPSASGSIDILNSVTSIGKTAFGGCTGLTSIDISSVTIIGEGAFAGCTSLIGITIPDGVTEIGGWAFDACSSLTSIIIPASVTSIGWYAFSWCRNLTSVTFEGTITNENFGGNAFLPEEGDEANGDSLKIVYLEDGEGTYTREENGEVWTKE